MDFVFWTVDRVRQACRLDSVENFDDDYLVHDGAPLTGTFPEDATFRMKESFPDDTLLTDSLINLNCFIIASEKTKTVLEGLGAENVEFLPVVVRDHRDKAVKTQYFIVNPLTQAPILKADQSGVAANEFVPEAVGSLQQFIADDAAVAAAPPVFRVKGIREYVAVRKDAARALTKAGLTNNRWIEPSGIANGESFGSLEDLPDEATAQL